jgi:hypothetical protein
VDEFFVTHFAVDFHAEKLFGAGGDNGEYKTGANYYDGNFN